MHSFVIFSSLNNLKIIPLTGPLRMGKEAFLEERLFIFYYLTTLYPAGLPARIGREKDTAKPNDHNSPVSWDVK